MKAVEKNTFRYDAHQLYNFSTGGVTVETVERDLSHIRENLAEDLLKQSPQFTIRLEHLNYLYSKVMDCH